MADTETKACAVEAMLVVHGAAGGVDKYETWCGQTLPLTVPNVTETYQVITCPECWHRHMGLIRGARRVSK